MSSLHQLANDPEDPRLSTDEYEFLYKMYKGVWRRHVDRDDEFFPNIWNYLNDQNKDAKAGFNVKTRWLHQLFPVGDTLYVATWTDCSSMAKLEEPPTFISWENPMLPPANTQPSLF
jgi:hypothetical protein